MKNVILVGHGKMGRMIEEMILSSNDLSLLGVVDVDLFETPGDVPGKADLLIDFSYPGNLERVLDYGVSHLCPLVLGTTGLTETQVEMIRRASLIIPIVHSFNYSTGVAALRAAVSLLAGALGGEFDMEIVETHHNQKADAPSGTAKLLLKALDPEGEYRHVFGRAGITGARGKEIGVHAVRGGTVAGEHSVFFFGEDETIELRHSAQSRKIFVSGALRAARFVLGKPAGLYGMDDVLKGALA